MADVNHNAKLAEDLRDIADAVANDEVVYEYTSEYDRQTMEEQLELTINWG